MADRRTSIDAAADRLAAAYRQAGLPPLRAPHRVDAVLDEIRTETAPMRLPDELERFWRLVDPESITLAPYPHPMSVAFALRSWRMHRDEAPGMTPRALFPFAYESHGFLSVALEDGQGNGGAVVQWGYGDEAFRVRFPTLTACVDLLARMIESEEFTRHDDDASPWVEFDPERRWQDAQAVRLLSAGAEAPDRAPEQREIQDNALAHDLEGIVEPVAGVAGGRRPRRRGGWWCTWSRRDVIRVSRVTPAPRAALSARASADADARWVQSSEGGAANENERPVVVPSWPCRGRPPRRPALLAHRPARAHGLSCARGHLEPQQSDDQQMFPPTHISRGGCYRPVSIR